MGHRTAVLIGVGRFEDQRIAALTCPPNDVKELAAILRDDSVGQFSDVVPLTDRDSSTCLRHVERALVAAKGDDLVLVYYSGHGLLPYGELHLACVDTDRDLLRSSAIPISTLWKMFEHSPCQQKILILDCCYSGSVARVFSGKGDDNAVLQAQLAPREATGTYVLTATSHLQEATELPGERLSLYTGHLVSGLRSGDADLNADGRIGVDECSLYLSRRLGALGIQSPMRWQLAVSGEPYLAVCDQTLRQNTRRRARDALVAAYAAGALPDDVYQAALAISVDAASAVGREPQWNLLVQLSDEVISGEQFALLWSRQEAMRRQTEKKQTARALIVSRLRHMVAFLAAGLMATLRAGRWVLLAIYNGLTVSIDKQLPAAAAIAVVGMGGATLVGTLAPRAVEVALVAAQLLKGTDDRIGLILVLTVTALMTAALLIQVAASELPTGDYVGAWGVGIIPCLWLAAVGLFVLQMWFSRSGQSFDVQFIAKGTAIGAGVGLVFGGGVIVERVARAPWTAGAGMLVSLATAGLVGIGGDRLFASTFAAAYVWFPLLLLLVGVAFTVGCTPPRPDRLVGPCVGVYLLWLACLLVSDMSWPVLTRWRMGLVSTSVLAVVGLMVLGVAGKREQVQFTVATVVAATPMLFSICAAAALSQMLVHSATVRLTTASVRDVIIIVGVTGGLGALAVAVASTVALYAVKE